MKINIVKLDGIGDAMIFLCAAKDAGINLNDPSVWWYTTGAVQSFLSELLPNANIKVAQKNIFYVIKHGIKRIFSSRHRESITLLALKSDIFGNYNKRVAFVVGGTCFRISGFNHKNPFKFIFNAIGRLAIGKTVKIDETSDYAAYKKFLNSVNDNFELPQHADQIKQEILRKTDIIICPGASSVKKRYPIEGYLRLYKDLLNSFNNIKFVIGPSEPDITPYLIDNGVAQKDIYNDLQANEFVNLIQHSKLVISNDSMAAHISNLTGTTLLCLAWGVRYNRFIKYLEKNNTVLSYPCEYHNCDACVFHDQRKYQCIKSLKYENIFNDALRLMNV